MSCLSRLLGLICAVVPGLLFLAFSARFFFLWPKLGFVIGPFYSLVSLITGIVCLYLGLSLLFGNNQREENIVATEAVPSVPAENFVAREPVPAPLPVAEEIEAIRAENSLRIAPVVSESENASANFAQSSAPLDTPESRIRKLAASRPGWQATAPQLAQLANLPMGVADDTARAMASNGDAQIQTGPHGETVYLFDLSDETPLHNSI